MRTSDSGFSRSEINFMLKRFIRWKNEAKNMPEFSKTMNADEMRVKFEEAKVRRLHDAETERARQQTYWEHRADTLTADIIATMSKELRFPYLYSCKEEEFQHCAERIASNLRRKKIRYRGYKFNVGTIYNCAVTEL